MKRAARTFDIIEVQTNLENLIDNLRPGEYFFISVGGQPKVKVIALTKQEIKQHLEESALNQ